MTTVKCPICKERVSAANTEDLNTNLRAHLAEVHNMRELYRGSRGEAPSGPYYSDRYVGTERVEPSREERRVYEGSKGRYEERRDYPYYTADRPDVGFSSPRTRTEREVETWSNRNPERFREENYVPREEVRQWRYPVTGEYGERGPYFEREGRGKEMSYERREVRGRDYDNPAIVNCPMCGQLIRGADEDDLSDELRYHMSVVHDVKPKMSARMRV
jgi:predicted small metal-binding protein